MKKAIYAGSFDPITHGHNWMIKQGSLLFDELIVVIAFNPDKKGYFTPEERLVQIQDQVKVYNNVKILLVPDRYVADVAKENNCQYLLRGIRNLQDFEYEKTIERVNLKINPSLQTIYLTPPVDLAEVSSSLVKSLVGFPGWQKLVSTMVSPVVVSGFLGKMNLSVLKSAWESLAGTDAVSEKWFNKIIQHHSEPHRFYHNTGHLSALVKHAQKLPSMDSLSKASILYTIFFHDIVYNPLSKTNESDSAKVWLDFAAEKQVIHPIYENVEKAILATASHFQPTQLEFIEYFLDLDLSILGSSPKDFKEYEDNIRSEYNFVPEDVYNLERAKIMKTLINPFKTQWAKNIWGQQAEENLKKYG
jgi:pantetheine-phosphate adenylyltransferase